MITAYLFVKFAFLFGLVRAAVRFEPLQERPFFMAALFTGGIAFLSVMMLGINDWRRWEWWLARSFFLSWLYFWLLGRFEDAGLLWWVVLLAGLGLVWY